MQNPTFTTNPMPEFLGQREKEGKKPSKDDKTITANLDGIIGDWNYLEPKTN